MGRILETLLEAAQDAATSFGDDAVALEPQTIVLTGNEGSVSIIDANPMSVGLVIGVPSPQEKNAFMAFGSDAVLNAGISLISGERPLIFLSALSALELFAISSPNGSTIAWQQFVRQQP